MTGHRKYCFCQWTLDRPYRTLPPGLALIMMAYLLLGAFYVIQSPLVIKPDELWHLAYVEYLKQHGQWPVMRLVNMPPIQRERWEPEAHQPPLYYALVAALTLAHPMDDAAQLYQRNPHFLSTPEGNHNLFIPAPSRSAVVLYIGRFVSLAFGAALGLLTYAIAREFVGPTASALAMSLALFNPQFLFISTAMSNAVPSAALATWGVWLAIRVVRDGLTTRRALAFGLAVAFSTLTKLSGLVLLGLVPFIALSALRQQTWRSVIRNLWLSLGAVLVLLAPWFAYNLQTYGDARATTPFFVYMGPRRAPLTPELWLEFLNTLWKSYWLDFSVGGQGFAIDAAYWIPAALIVVGLTGAIWQVWRRPAWRAALLVLAIWFVLVLGALLSLQTRTNVFIGGGRLLFSACASLAVLTALGLMAFVPLRALLALTLLAPAMALLAALVYLWPQSHPLDVWRAKPLSAKDGEFRLGEQARIRGYAIEPDRVAGGDLIYVYVAWEALQPFAENDSVFAQLWDVRAPAPPRVVAQVDTYPGLGLLPTRGWSPHQIVVDRYPLKLSADLPAGWQGMVVVGLYNLNTGQRLPLFDSGSARMPFDAAPLGFVKVSAQ